MHLLLLCPDMRSTEDFSQNLHSLFWSSNKFRPKSSTAPSLPRLSIFQSLHCSYWVNLFFPCLPNPKFKLWFLTFLKFTVLSALAWILHLVLYAFLAVQLKQIHKSLGQMLATYVLKQTLSLIKQSNWELFKESQKQYCLPALLTFLQLTRRLSSFYQDSVVVAIW